MSSFPVIAEIFSCADKSYGLLFKDTAGNILKSFYSVSNNYDFLFEFVQKCNNSQLSALHIDDVLEDFIS